MRSILTRSATNGSPPSASDGERGSLLWRLLFLADAVILYGAFVGALKARLGAGWFFPPHELVPLVPLVVTLGVYALALVASGLYRRAPRRMHLGTFLRTAAVLLVAWTASLTLVYLVAPTQMPPRSVTAIHCLFAIAGVLGLRALIRQGLEWMEAPTTPRAASPAPAPLTLGDLLPREPVAIDEAGVRHYLAGRTVLVTGAGGSIGTELSRQLIGLQPFRLVLVDISEYNLFRLENALRRVRFDGELEFCIGDVRDRAIMENLFSSFQPDVVLHTAAYKHVPLMERHPAEAFRNNTLTTTGLLHLCEQYETEQFVFVSTDKAVEPSSVLGATKRLAEWFVQVAESPVERKIVRFGNVFGSQGSVVPLFEKQLAEEGTVGVTHPEMERYFMSAHEACSLILQTLLLDEAPIYIFDMGEPVRIQWLAEEVVRRRRPGADPADFIRHTGIRPGEKLSEELAMPSETAQPTRHARIIGLQGPVPHSRTELELHLRALEALAADGRTATLRKALFETELNDETEQIENRR